MLISNWWVQKFELNQPFTTSRGNYESVDAVLVSIQYLDHIGYGTCIVEKHKNVDLDRLKYEVEAIIPELKAVTIQELHAFLENISPSHNSPRKWTNNSCSGVIMAGLDLLAKWKALPLFEYLEAPAPLEIFSSMTLPLSTEQELCAQLETYRHWKTIKVKVGKSFDQGLLSFLRAHYSGTLIVDANGSWDLETGLKHLQWIDSIGVDIIEEPVSDGLQTLLSQVPRSHVKVFADESCVSEADIIRLSEWVDGVVLKQNKNGGLLVLQQYIALAKAQGLEVMLSSKVESQIGVLSCAQLSANAHYCDLDGHLFLKHDVFAGLAMDLTQGKLNLNTQAGIGVQRI